jgi:hypothetical protein
MIHRFTHGKIFHSDTYPFLDHKILAKSKSETSSPPMMILAVKFENPTISIWFFFWITHSGWKNVNLINVCTSTTDNRVSKPTHPCRTCCAARNNLPLDKTRININFLAFIGIAPWPVQSVEQSLLNLAKWRWQKQRGRISQPASRDRQMGWNIRTKISFPQKKRGITCSSQKSTKPF